MTLLIFFIVLSIGVSFLCSILEAVILSVTPSYLGTLKKSDPKLFKNVSFLKEDIDRPLASILTFNTVAHTVGAAGAGAQAQFLFGSESLAIFSAILTFGILFFSEIIPKSIGAKSWKLLLPLSAKILKPMIWISFPVVWISNQFSKMFKGEAEGISRDEIISMADMGLHDGALEKNEHNALKGLIQFKKVKAQEVMTSKEKVESVLIEDTLEDAYKKIQSHPYSRIIVLDAQENASGFILRNQLLEAHIAGSLKKVKDLIHPISTYSHEISLPGLFRFLLNRREHICAIVNDKKIFAGVISLEDLIEHMLNVEIYDEQDHLIKESRLS